MALSQSSEGKQLTARFFYQILSSATCLHLLVECNRDKLNSNFIQCCFNFYAMASYTTLELELSKVSGNMSSVVFYTCAHSEAKVLCKTVHAVCVAVSCVESSKMHCASNHPHFSSVAFKMFCQAKDRHVIS